MSIRYKEKLFGFEYGSIEVQRLFSDKKKGSVVIAVDSEKIKLQIYATKTGKIRIYKDGNELISIRTIRKSK